MNTILIRILLILIVVTSTIACFTKDDQTKENLSIKDETPKVLTEKEYTEGADLLFGGSYSSISGRGNLVDLLFDEAQEKDLELNNLMRKINEIDENSIDSIGSYKDYSETNQFYWSYARDYSAQIRDTILMKEVVEILDILQKKYIKNLKPYHDIMTSRIYKSTELQDRLIVLKLMTSLEMILNYQKNELPNITPLENLLNDYDQLIEEVKEKTEIKK